MIGTHFNYYDLSQIEEIEDIEVTDNSPVVLAACGADKGTEDLIQIKGKDFVKMFGQPSFKKYGQASISVRRAIDNGASVLFKRIVPDDARLSQLMLVAKVWQYRDLVYGTGADANKVKCEGLDGSITYESIDENNKLPINKTPILETQAFVRYEVYNNATSVGTGFKTPDEVIGAITDLTAFSDTGTSYGKSESVHDTEKEAQYGVTNIVLRMTTVTSSEVTDPETHEVTGTQFTVNKAVFNEETKQYTGGSEVTAYTYPLFAMYDCGRGMSNKRFRIVPEYKLSKNLPFMYYTITGLENGAEIEQVTFAMVPDTIVSNACIDLNTISGSDLKYIKAYQNEDSFNAYVAKLSELSGIDSDDLFENDMIFGCNRKGVEYPTITIEGIDFQNVTGQGLTNWVKPSLEQSGVSQDVYNTLPDNADGSWTSNGPMVPDMRNTTEPFTSRNNYFSKIAAFYNGNDTEEVFDLDSYQIDVVFDAAYPTNVKAAIAGLQDFRKDFLYVRDYSRPATKTVGQVEKGAEGIWSPSVIGDLSDIRDNMADFPHQYGITDYCQAYDIIDSYSKKQISVSIVYSLIPMILSKLKIDRSVPLAGQRNSAVIDEIVQGSLNYKPRMTPEVNEKDTLEDLRVNFGSYYKDQFVLETVYTSQDDYTQLSYSNNVLSMQMVIKALRAYFPAIRYAVITSTDDIDQITSQVNNMLNAYRGSFEELTFTYTGDNKYIANKIYKAKIEYRFNNFIQAEIIDAYALPSNV